MLDRFIAFAKDASADLRESIDDAMGAIIATHAVDGEFDEGELDILDRRLAEPRPQYAAQETIADLLGKPFKT